MNTLTLSRGTLQVRRGGSQEERRSTAPYFIHQAVADLFGDHTTRGYLYRVTAEWPGGVDVLILSQVPPLPLSQLASPKHRRVMRVESRPFAPELSSGQPLDYEIRLNATRVVTHPDGKKQRTDVWEAVWQPDKNTPRSPHEVYGEYLARKLDGAAEVLDARVTERGEVQARRGGRGDVARFVATNLIGTLRVADPERFLEVLANGIGRAKAFGCGLLCLSRPGTMLARRYPDRAVGML
jgi:CRISPR system Cascade subunit CasE